jgi:hypothetical protein
MDKAELKEQPFIESSIETMDTALFNYLNGLEFQTTQQGEAEKVPLIWSSSERVYQIKNSKELRDDNETLKLPLMTVYRASIQRDTDTFPFTPGNNFYPIARRILPVQTQKFANAVSRKKFGVSNSRFDNDKVVYETLYSENIVAVLANYNVLIRTNYLLDMNQILNKFLTATTYREVKIKHEEHSYYLTLPTEFSFDKISETLDTEERMFETTIELKVRGALFPRIENVEDKVIKTAQNAVNIKFNKERTIVGDQATVAKGVKTFVEE